MRTDLEAGGEGHDERIRTADALFDEANRLYRRGELTYALEAFDELENYCAGADDPLLRRSKAAATVAKALTLAQLARWAEAIRIADAVVEELAAVADPGFQKHVAMALLAKRHTLHRMGRRHEALETLDELLRRFGEARKIEFDLAVSQGLVERG